MAVSCQWRCALIGLMALLLGACGAPTSLLDGDPGSDPEGGPGGTTSPSNPGPGDPDSPGEPDDPPADDPPADDPPADDPPADDPATPPADDPVDRNLGAPSACEQAVTAEQDSPITIVLTGTSPAGRALAFTVVGPPACGTLGPLTVLPLNLAVLRYTPAPGYVGPDAFTYVVSDGPLDSPPALVTIDVRPTDPGLPACCPRVRFDEEGHFVVNGDKVLPVGYWGSYQAVPLEGWAAHAAGFRGLTASGTSPARLAGCAAYGVLLQAQGMLIFDYTDPENPFIDNSRVAAAACESAILSWEVQHEPNAYPLTTLHGDVGLQAELIRQADPCGRPVLVTPTAGADQLFAVYAQFVDYTALQYFPTPSFRLATLANHIDQIRERTGKPACYVYRSTGYQPQRYRFAYREPTVAEARAAAYLALLHGVNGFWFWCYSKGAADRGLYGFPEESDALYRVVDSPDLAAGLAGLGAELQEWAPLLLAPRGADTAVASCPDVHAAVFDVNGPLPGGEYLVCVNVSETASPYFEYVSGSQAMLIRSYALTPDGRAFPPTACNDGRDNDGDGLIDTADPGCFGLEDESENTELLVFDTLLRPSRLYLRFLHTGIWNQDEPIDRVHVRFESAPPGSQFQLAIYSDEDRDRGPDTRLYQSAWLDIPEAGGWVETTLDWPVTLEHTRDYFILMRVNQEGIVAQTQDVRHGTTSLPGYAELADTFPPLTQGRAETVTLTLGTGAFRSYRALRATGEREAAAGTITGGSFTDTFQPYAVHVYQLVP